MKAIKDKSKQKISSLTVSIYTKEKLWTIEIESGKSIIEISEPTKCNLIESLKSFQGIEKDLLTRIINMVHRFSPGKEKS